MVSLSNTNINANAIVIILLGIIACSFPFITTMTVGMISGFAFFMISISLILFGISLFNMNKLAGIVNILLAFIAIFLSLSLIFNPDFVAGFISFISYFVGTLMIVSGLFYVFMGSDYAYFTYYGIITIILGISYIVLSAFAGTPVNLGIIVGIWLIISGIFDLFR